MEKEYDDEEEIVNGEGISFDEWLDTFDAECKKLNYNGPIDRDTFYDDWDNGGLPEEVAKDFVDEMTS